MYAAMKAKDKERKNALSMLLGALKAKAIDKREDLTEAEENSIIAKEIKQCKDTIEMSPADRTDIIDQCKLRIAVYEEFAPKQMSEDEIKATIQSVLDELGITEPTGKDRGKIMKDLMPKVKGKADGKLVNQMVASMLKQIQIDRKKENYHIPDATTEQMRYGSFLFFVYTKFTNQQLLSVILPIFYQFLPGFLRLILLFQV